MEQIEITIKDGKLEIEAIGFTGPACADAIKELLGGLGTVIAEEHKPEYKRRQASQSYSQAQRTRA